MVLHKNDERFLNAKVSQLSKPKLGQKPLSKEDIAERSALMTQEMRDRHRVELSELEERLAASASVTSAPQLSPAHGNVHATEGACEVSTSDAPAGTISAFKACPVTPSLATEAAPYGGATGSPHSGTRSERRKVGFFLFWYD